MSTPPQIRERGLLPYAESYAEMQAFNRERDEHTPDEIWLLEHPPVYTQGQAGRAEHILNPGDIPVIATDRGGQVTYHGPGQIVMYPLLDLKRLGLGPKSLVHGIEQVTIDWLASRGLSGQRRDGAPGVYVGERKIASLGIRIRRGCCYHGLALNVAMDLEPFSRINPCGYAGLTMTQLAELGVDCQPLEVGRALATALVRHFATEAAA